MEPVTVTSSRAYSVTEEDSPLGDGTALAGEAAGRDPEPEADTREGVHTELTCEVLVCGQPAEKIVYHPQRGSMAVCERHARRIHALGVVG